MCPTSSAATGMFVRSSSSYHGLNSAALVPGPNLDPHHLPIVQPYRSKLLALGPILAALSRVPAITGDDHLRCNAIGSPITIKFHDAARDHQIRSELLGLH